MSLLFWNCNPQKVFYDLESHEYVKGSDKIIANIARLQNFAAGLQGSANVMGSIDLRHAREVVQTGGNGFDLNPAFIKAGKMSVDELREPVRNHFFKRPGLNILFEHNGRLSENQNLNFLLEGFDESLVFIYGLPIDGVKDCLEVLREVSDRVFVVKDAVAPSKQDKLGISDFNSCTTEFVVDYWWSEQGFH